MNMKKKSQRCESSLEVLLYLRLAMMLQSSVYFEKLLRAPTVTDELPLKSRT
jgi:hypothetical protein